VKKKINQEELIDSALEQLNKAYAPFSGFAVGAALLSKSGKVFTGVNVENSSYGLSICAERVACVKAVSEGEKEFDMIVVATDSDEPSTPCGACRQFLWEFGDMRVILVNKEKKTKEYMLSELLPDGFILK